VTEKIQLFAVSNEFPLSTWHTCLPLNYVL